MPDEYLDSAGVARLLGVSPATIRAYRSRGQAGFPEPDVTVGDTPGWLPSTIERWREQRRGPGNWRRPQPMTNAEQMTRALELLRTRPGITPQQLADELHLTPEAIADLITKAAEAGFDIDEPRSRRRAARTRSKEN